MEINQKQLHIFNDGLTDSEEVNTYNTNPLEKDTDGDTLSDGDDVALGFSPLLQDTDGDGILDCDEKIEQTMSQSIEDEEKPEVTDVTVSFSGTGNIDNTTTIENIYNVDILSSEVVGLVGVPVEIKTTSQFDEAVITFTYDDTQLGDTPEENLSVMWYDEENNWFQILDRESVVDTENNTVSVTTTHFSKYMLVDKVKWFNKWETELSYTRDNNQSYHFSFVVDVSGSMQGSSLASAKEALNQFADSFTEQDTKSLVAFNHTAVEVSHIWDTVEQFKTAVSNLRADGGTSVRAGLSKGIEIVDAMDSSMPKVIILLCDGDVDYCNDLVEYCVTSKIKIFAVNVVTADSAALQDMAQKTGGGYYIASTDSELTSVMNRINNEIDPTDTDSDGLPDVFEKQGMLTINGQIYKSNPKKCDSDNDGVSDGAEMGIPEGEDFKDYILARFVYLGRGISRYRVYFNPISNPRNPDSDGDFDGDAVDPKPYDYQLNDLLCYNISKLNNLAIDYKNKNKNNYESDEFNTTVETWLAFMFIRQFNSNYVGDKWNGTGKSIDDGFVEYVKNENAELYTYFENTSDFYATPSGKTGDLYHLAATATGYIYNSNYGDGFEFGLMPEHHLNRLSGWAGDLQTLMRDTYNELYGSDDYNEFYNKLYQLIGDNSKSFSMKDLYADIDARNIYTLLDGTSNNLADSFKTYYSNSSDGYRKRYSSFTNNEDRETILNIVKIYTNTYFIYKKDMLGGIFKDQLEDTLRWPLFNDGNKVDVNDYFDFSENQSKAAADAFTDFLMHKVQMEVNDEIKI